MTDTSVMAQTLQAAVDAQLGRGHVHSVVAAVQSDDGSLDFVGSAGVADPSTGAAMTSDTPYFLGSVTKMYTAAIVLQLFQEKCIDLEAPITRYLPDTLTRGIHIYRGTDHSRDITVSQLLGQTSGLPDYEAGRPRGGRSVLDELKAGHDREIHTREAMDIVRELTPRFPPGAAGKAHYSNANYRLLGAIIESVTDTRMAENFQQRIFAPLGLQHSYLFDWKAPRPGQQPATLYLKGAPAHVPKYLSSDVADGGLVSTAPESMTFVRAFFEGRLFDGTLLPRMMTWNRIFFPLRYGYGLMDFRLPRFFWPRPLPEFIGHSGTTGAFAFTCPSPKVYITGTLNVIAPARPYLLATTLARAVS